MPKASRQLTLGHTSDQEEQTNGTASVNIIDQMPIIF